MRRGRHTARPFTADIRMLIPFDLLEPETLTRVIEDFVTREGTDNGDDTPLETRVARVMHALRRKEAFIAFDAENQQCQLMHRRDVPQEWITALSED